MPKLVNPLPQALPKECAKAEDIFKRFVVRSNNTLDGLIPRVILEHACGFAIFTIVKAGILLSARGGSGIVIARLEDGSWSAPSAIALVGVGLGGQVGAEMTDFVIVLNSRSAVNSFMATGSLTLGGNMSLAIGPQGLNGEAAGALSSRGEIAAMYSYSKTRGLFGGVSVEGSAIIERQIANSNAYHPNVSSKQILRGDITPPDWAQSLIDILESCTNPPLSQRKGIGRVIALYDFRAEKPGDLTFSKGQVIFLTEKSDSKDAWWKGKLKGREGSFPANYVEVV